MQHTQPPCTTLHECQIAVAYIAALNHPLLTTHPSLRLLKRLKGSPPQHNLPPSTPLHLCHIAVAHVAAVAGSALLPCRSCLRCCSHPPTPHNPPWPSIGSQCYWNAPKPPYPCTCVVVAAAYIAALILPLLITHLGRPLDPRAMGTHQNHHTLAPVS